MQILFRMECPECHWGHEVKNNYINQGFLKGKCRHCGNIFYFKVNITGINVLVKQDLPKGQPCKILKEAT